MDQEFSACGLCGSSDGDEVYNGLAFRGRRPLRIVRCKHCRLMYQNPRRTSGATEEHYRTIKMADIYAPSFEQRRNAQERELNTLERMTAGRRLLDVGCATGHFMTVARDRGWSVTGVEPNEDCVRHAREKFSLNVICGTVTSDELADARFDVITLAYMLEHLPSPLDTVRIALRRLAPDGILYITVPNVGALPVRIRMRLGRFSGSREADPGHANFFTAETLTDLVKRGGGRVLRLRDGVSGGVIITRLPGAVPQGPTFFAALDAFDTMTGLISLGSTLRIWATAAADSITRTS